jgi:EAL domain-containing protein (putative c-di-GMP-specific phosphodiesterase class I)
VLIFDPSAATEPTSAGSGAAIAEVIARGQLRPVYQPIISLGGLTTLGYEGLIRPVPPAPFENPLAMFDAAASSGHLVALDMSCIETIVAGADDLPPGAFLSVNISPRTVESPEFTTPALLSILARHGFDPHRLVLELTEREAIDDVERVRVKLEACRVAGISIAADDVGAGNSGLRLLSELRFEVIKVDLSLVQRIAPGAPSSAVIESVVALAAKTGSLVIGEGVEKAEDVAHLQALGVAAAQGYFFSHPGPLAPSASPSTVADPSSGAAPQPVVIGIRPRELVAQAETDGAGMSAWRQGIGLPTPVG